MLLISDGHGLWVKFKSCLPNYRFGKILNAYTRGLPMCSPQRPAAHFNCILHLGFPPQYRPCSQINIVHSVIIAAFRHITFRMNAERCANTPNTNEYEQIPTTEYNQVEDVVRPAAGAGGMNPKNRGPQEPAGGSVASRECRFCFFWSPGAKQLSPEMRDLLLHEIGLSWIRNVLRRSKPVIGDAAVEGGASAMVKEDDASSSRSVP